VKHFQKITDFPKGSMLAVIRNRKIHLPGDERSRQAPGHGYGPEDVDTFEIIGFGTVLEVETFLEKELDKQGGPPNFIVVEMRQLEFTREVNVKVGS
jgi:hypothetical protein